MPAARSSAGRRRDLLDADAFLHRVENALRSRFGAHPHRPAGRRLQRSGDGRRDLIGPQQALERNRRVALADQRRELLDPARLEAEDVVGHRHVIRPIGALEPQQFVDDALGRSAGVALTVDRLRAPVAVVRTAPRRHQVHGVVAVRAPPQRPVSIDVDQIPRGHRQRVEIADDLAAWRAADGAAAVAQAEAAHLGQSGRRAPAGEHVEHLDQRHFALAGNHDIRAARRGRSPG